MNSFYSYNNSIQQAVTSTNEQLKGQQSKLSAEKTVQQLRDSVFQSIGTPVALPGIKAGVENVSKKIGGKIKQAFNETSDQVKSKVKGVQDQANTLKQKLTQQSADKDIDVDGIGDVGQLKTASKSLKSRFNNLSQGDQSDVMQATRADPEFTAGATGLDDLKNNMGVMQENIATKELANTPPTQAAVPLKTTVNKTGADHVDVDDADPFSGPRSLSQQTTAKAGSTDAAVSSDVSNVSDAVGTGASDAAAGITEGLGEATAVSTGLDETGVGLAVTAALGIASMFASFFEHKPQASPIHPLNPSSQFGSSE
jgi:hypothetical protein